MQTDGRTMDRHTDNQRETNIPRHYRELGYKNESGHSISYKIACTPSQGCPLEDDLDHWLSTQCSANVTKAYLYNFDPLNPYFYIVKLGFTGVYIIFLISAQT